MDPIDKDLIVTKYKKRFRIMFGVTGFMSFLAFIFFIYAFVQKGIADENLYQAMQMARSADSLRVKLNQCGELAKSQQQMAEAAMEQARQAQQRAETALQKALKK